MLSLTGLEKTYAGGVRALDGVSLDVPKGLFGLLGPNGAGKSSLMRTVATLQDPDSGEIRFDGVDVRRDKQALRKRLGYLPQEFGTYPRVSAQDMLAHLATLKGITGKARSSAVDALLQRVNLWEHRKRSVDTYSGGMRQRFGIAQALLGDPDLIIVDEPTAGLDPVERRRFQNLLSEVGEEVVIILSTHIVEDISALCQRLAIMAGGSILAEGTPGELIAGLRGRLWQRHCARAEAGTLSEGLLVISSRIVAGESELQVLSAQCPEGFAAIEPTLEDVYFACLLEHGHSVEVI